MRVMVADYAIWCTEEGALHTLKNCSPMIAGFRCPMRIGEVFSVAGQPLVVVRASSYQEWCDCHPSFKAITDVQHKYFYEVTTD